MEIIYLKEVDSTHLYLKNYIKKYNYSNPLAIATQCQTSGVGSRDNTWDGEKGNLFFSFVIHKSALPYDLPLQSTSIYFSFIFKEMLSKYGSNLILKWPNDFYIDDKKIGGTITNLIDDKIYCGIGLNLLKNNEKYGYLDIEFNLEEYLRVYFSIIESKSTWKQIFSKYSLEFKNNKQFTTTVNNKKVSLSKAVLNDDGSIEIDKKKVFSLR